MTNELTDPYNAATVNTIQVHCPQRVVSGKFYAKHQRTRDTQRHRGANNTGSVMPSVGATTQHRGSSATIKKLRTRLFSQRLAL